MTIEEEAEEYLHQEFLKMKDPLYPDRPIPTEEDWKRTPAEVKKQIVDLVLGFNNKSNPLIEKIKSRLKLRDNELGMYVKNLLR